MRVKLLKQYEVLHWLVYAAELIADDICVHARYRESIKRTARQHIMCMTGQLSLGKHSASFLN